MAASDPRTTASGISQDLKQSWSIYGQLCIWTYCLIVVPIFPLLDSLKDQIWIKLAAWLVKDYFVMRILQNKYLFLLALKQQQQQKQIARKNLR